MFVTVFCMNIVLWYFLSIICLYPSHMQASLNSQIVKWFQNNEHANRKACGTTRKWGQPSQSSVTSSPTSETNFDEDADEHLSELKKELSRKRWDVDKIVRFLSLTYKSRTETRDAQRGSHSRIAVTMMDFPCFKQPLFVSQY